MLTITITHTHEAGTLIDGTAKGDGTAEVLKASGWRWGRSIAAWYIPNSRDHLPTMWKIDRTAEALRAAGFEVTTEVSTEHRSTADVEAGKIARQEGRVDALDAKAARKSADDDAAWERAKGALRRLPAGGEPIHVGHHSEGRHRNAIKKADTAMRRSVEASQDAERARGRAEAASHTTDGRYAPITVANRIEKLGAEIRKLQRTMNDDVYDYRNGYRRPTEEESTARTARLTPQIEEKRDQLVYWEGVRAAQIESGEASGYNRTNVHKGDRVRFGSTWCEVVRANPKTVTVPGTWGGTTTVPYVSIQECKPAPVTA